MLQRQVYVGLVGYLGSRFQARFFFYLLQPFQAYGPYPFKVPGTGPGLPDPGPIVIHIGVLQLVCDPQYLLFRFRAAGSCNNQGMG